MFMIMYYQVQEAVASCLPPLVPSIRDEVSELIGKLLQLLLSSDNYGERRGAAYGLAGLVKGSGILSLKQLDIMTTLTAAVQNKKSAKEREGRWRQLREKFSLNTSHKM